MIKKITGCLMILFMAGVVMANPFQTKLIDKIGTFITSLGNTNSFSTKVMKKIETLAMSPGKTYCIISNDTADSLKIFDSLSKVSAIGKPCDGRCNQYLAHHRNSVFLTGNVFKEDPKAQCFNTTPNFDEMAWFCYLDRHKLHSALEIFPEFYGYLQLAYHKYPLEEKNALVVYSHNKGIYNKELFGLEDCYDISWNSGY